MGVGMGTGIAVFFLYYAILPIAAIVGGLLIFFLGRRHVRRKYGGT